MAQLGNELNQKRICCSICLDPLKNPVTIPCGHSYCMVCIKDHWDVEDERSIYKCPQCRQPFTPRPVLPKNTMLADLVDELKKTGLQAAPADHCYAGPEDVACDFCTGRKLKACKSCLQCLASYCKEHLQPHFDAAPLQKHKLVEPSKKLLENICSRHNEVMKMFCRTDQKSICYLCSMNEHKDHDTVSTAAERSERQRELGESRQNIQQRIQDREKDLKMLQKDLEAINLSADKAVEHSEKIFTQLIRLMEERRSDVKQQVRSQQDTEVSRVQELEKKLEQEIRELKRRDANLEELSRTEDHNQFLQDYKSLSALSGSSDSSSINIRPLRNFEAVTAAVTEARDQLQDLLKKTWRNISTTVTKVDVLLPQPERKTRAQPEPLTEARDELQDVLKKKSTNISQTVTKVDVLLPKTVPKSRAEPEPLTEVRDQLQGVLKEKWPNIPQTVTKVDVLLPQPEPRTRAEFLQYSCDLSLDPNTAHTQLLVSDGNKKATVMTVNKPHPRHPDRFTGVCQVLSRESLTGRCYWEVEWRGEGVHVAVAYKNISRTGRAKECGFGGNDKSWALNCTNSYTFMHNNVKTPVSGPRCSRVGVYLDHRAGVLSFYIMTKPMMLLRRVQTTFTQPLYAGVRFYSVGDTAEFCKVKSR